MRTSTYNIFYTDDDIDDQIVFKEVVGDISSHYYVYTQNDGDELLNLLKSPPPQAGLIFLDLNMPNKNGYEVLEELRKCNLAGQIPVIVISTSSDETAISTSRALGAAMYITKPSSYTEFKKIMRSVLDMDWHAMKITSSNFAYNVN